MSLSTSCPLWMGPSNYHSAWSRADLLATAYPDNNAASFVNLCGLQHPLLPFPYTVRIWRQPRFRRWPLPALGISCVQWLPRSSPSRLLSCCKPCSPDKFGFECMPRETLQVGLLRDFYSRGGVATLFLRALHKRLSVGLIPIHPGPDCNCLQRSLARLL